MKKCLKSLLFVIIGEFIIFSLACKADTKPKDVITEPDNYILKYVQDFDSLGKTGGRWDDDRTIPGWWTTMYRPEGEKATANLTYEEMWNLDKTPKYYASSGETQIAGVLNLGSENTNDRALGTASSNVYQPTLYFVLKNDTEETITNVYVTYTGEQWRNSGNRQLDMEGVLQVSYAILSKWPENIYEYRSGSDPYQNTIALEELDFHAPQAGGIQIALDGNNPANQVKLSHSFEAIIPPESCILLKWFDPKENGNNSIMGIDDLKIICR